MEFQDGSVEEFTVNVIAEDIYSQVDQEGQTYAIQKEISNHRFDPTTEVREEDVFDTSYNRNKVLNKTTKGWELLVEWRDGASDWVSLNKLKESNPVDVAEYAVANRIDQSPPFHWWVHHVIKQHNWIARKVKSSKYWRTTHKFGIRLPKDTREVLQIDKETGTNFWEKAIEKELRKVKVAWETRDDLTVKEACNGKTLIGYTEIKCHMIFDVKMDFTQKARFVAGGHMTERQNSAITYSSVVSRDSVLIALTLAEMNGLNLMTCDVGNAYLHTP